MKVLTIIIIFFAVGIFAIEASSKESSKMGKNTGLPIPRFVSLKSNEANLRIGPEERFPIIWVYRKKHLPLKILKERGNWRKIEDFSGSRGWIHSSLLSGRRYAIINKQVILHYKPSNKTPPIIKAGKNVIGEIAKCLNDWCQLQIRSRKGWIAKQNIWGALPKEIF